MTPAGSAPVSSRPLDRSFDVPECRRIRHTLRSPYGIQEVFDALTLSCAPREFP